MSVQLKQGYGRIVAARQKLVDVRAARWETLQRFKTFAKNKLTDFVGSTDPVSGQRFVDISAGGDKARGEAAMVLSFFEGTRLRLTVDTHAQYGVESNPPELMSDVARIVDVIVPADMSRAEIIFEAVGGPAKALRRMDLNEVIVRMVECAAAGVEEELGDAARSLAPPAVAVAPSPKPIFTFSVG